MNQRMGARPWTGRTQLDYAHLLLARNKADDSHRGRELLDQALATYRDLRIRPTSCKPPSRAKQPVRLNVTEQQYT